MVDADCAECLTHLLSDQIRSDQIRSDQMSQSHLMEFLRHEVVCGVGTLRRAGDSY